MALTELIARLEHEAQTRVRAIQDKADAEVRAIEAATETAVAEVMARQFDPERAERQLVQQRELAAARRIARAHELEARRAQIARVLSRARTLLMAAGLPPTHMTALASHLEEALSFLHGLQPHVRCQSTFASALRAEIGRHNDLQLVIDESIGPGFIAEAGDGSVVVDDTLAARLGRLETHLTTRLAQTLADGGH